MIDASEETRFVDIVLGDGIDNYEYGYAIVGIELWSSRIMIYET